MRTLKAVFLLVSALTLQACILESCDKNPMAPSSTGGSSVEGGSYSGPKKWINPNLGSADYPDMFTHPESWPEALRKITTFQFHHMNLLRTDCVWCRENTLDKLIEVGAFRFLTDAGKKISIEAGSLKWINGRCGDMIPEAISSSREAINNIQSNGGIVSSISMDWPFGSVDDGCNLTDEEVAKFIAQYVVAIKSTFPYIAIGLVEGYPTRTAARMERMLDAMIRAGARPAFVHLDFDREAAQRSGPDKENSNGYNITKDIPEIRDVVKRRSIDFGVILFGAGDSSESYGADVIFSSQKMLDAAGSNIDHIIFESWSDLPSTRGSKSIGDDRLFPLNLPETKPGRLTWLVLNQGGRF